MPKAEKGLIAGRTSLLSFDKQFQTVGGILVRIGGGVVIVYVDVLLAINFAVNFVLMRITALLCGKRPFGIRLAIGAAIGAVGSLVLFLPPMGPVGQAFYRFALTLAICAVGFCPCKLWGYIKAVITLLLCSMLLCGALTLWQISFSPMGFAMKGGAVYFDIGAFALLVCCGAGYLAANAFSWVMRAVPKRQFCTVSVLNNGGCAVFTALIDTGNSLKEPFSGIPVIVCEKKALRSAAPGELEQFMKGEAQNSGMRLIPYKTVGSSGVLPAFLPEKVIIKRENGDTSDAKCYIAVTQDDFDGAWSGVCNPCVFSEKSYSGGDF